MHLFKAVLFISIDLTHLGDHGALSNHLSMTGLKVFCPHSPFLTIPYKSFPQTLSTRKEFSSLRL